MTPVRQSLVEGTQRALRSVIDLVYPPHCSVCRVPLTGGLLCSRCAEGLRSSPAAHELPPSRALDGGRCYGLYEEHKSLAVTIQKLKYRGDRALVSLLGPLLLDASQTLPQAGAVTFVPLHRRRRRKRGFNQARLLARYVAEALELPLLDLLRKTRRTVPQASLKRGQRLLNVRRAFAASPCSLDSVWLVDDVTTTGATLDACATALTRAGVQHVSALVLAMAAPGRA